MAILEFVEVPGKRITVNRKNVRTGVRKFRVKCDIPNQSTFSIRTHPYCPKPWSAHPEEPFCFADTPQITQRKSKWHWDVEVDYTSEVDGDEQPRNPQEREADIEWHSTEFTRLAYLDKDDRPILDTAGFPPEGGGLPVEDSFWTIHVSKNLPRVPKKIVTENYASSVNEDTVTIDGIQFEPNTLKAKRIDILKWDREEGIRFRPTTVTYHSRPDSFTQTMLNRGFHQLVARVDPTDSSKTIVKPERILVGGTDGTAGEPPNEPVFLDLQGHSIMKPKRGKVRFVKGGNADDPKVLPSDPDELKAELEKRSDIIVLKWDVERQLPFRNVLPLS